MLQALKRFGLVSGLGLMAALPLFGVAAAQDPFSVENCERRSANYLDCQCIADREQELREMESDRLLELNLNRVENVERRIALLEERLEAETNPSRITGYQNNIAKNQSQIAELKTRPDPASHKSSVLYSLVAKDGTCRSYEKTYAAAKEGCLTSPGSNNKDRAEAYCTCVAETVATDWVNAENPRQSQQTMQVRARTACQS